MSDRKRCLDDQDPDYPDVTTEDKKRQKLTIERARVDTCERMKNVIRNQFEMEIQQREGQLLECQERLHQARQALHLLRYIVVTSYYHGNTVSKEQSRLHPAVKKLVGTRKNLETVLTLDIPVTNFYPGIVPATSTGGGNSPVAASSSNATSLESSQYSAPTKQPRYIAPKEKNSKEGVSPPRAANLKTKTRLVVGNISKWIHDDMREDAATHKWMLYVRGPPEAPDISHMVERVRFFLHSSYQPNDVIEVANPPFYLSRRGWGEFPVRVQVHFHNPQNRPLDVIHQLRLDHTYTGLQTLGAETVVDVWLFGSNSKAESTNSNTEPSNQPNISNSSTDILMKEHPTEEFSLLSQQTNNTSPRLNTNRSLLKSINTRGSRQQERIETRIVEVDGIKDTNVTISHAQEKKDFHNSSVSQTKSVCGSKNETYNLNSAQHTFFKQNTTSHSTSMNIHEHDSKDNSSIVFQKKACNISCAIDQKQNSNHLISNKNSNQLDVALKLQHHDYAKPRQETVGLMCKDATTSSTKSILFCSKITSIKPNSSGSFCDRTNLTEIAGRKIINLKSRSTLNVSKCINVKNPIKIFNTSLLKSSVLKPDQNNTEKNISLINGSKVTITGSSTKIPKHVICLSINRNGALQHVPNFIRQTVPPLVMLSRPTEKKKQPMCLKQPTQCQFKHIDFNSIKIENERNNELLQYYKQHMKDLEIRKVDDEQVAILHLLRSLPLIKEADSAYFQLHPYVVASAEKFLAWPLGKRRAAEGMRAKEVCKLLEAQGFPSITKWKVAKLACRYGFTPIAHMSRIAIHENKESVMKERTSQYTYSAPSGIIHWLDTSSAGTSELDDDTQIDIETVEVSAICGSSSVEKSLCLSNKDFSTEDDPKEDRKRFICIIELCKHRDFRQLDLFKLSKGSTRPSSIYPVEESACCVWVKRLASQIGIILLPEAVDADVSICGAQITIAESSQRLIEDLVRRSLAACWTRTNGCPETIELVDILSALQSRPEFDLFSNHGLGVEIEDDFKQ